jgi:Bax protein
MSNSIAISIIPLAIFMLVLLLWVANCGTDQLLQETLTPDFSAIKDVKTKKRTFFAYLLPLVQQSNKDISRKRVALLQVSQRLKHQRTLTTKQTETIYLLAKKYRVTAHEPFSAGALTLLERRIDTIPVALALAQAANESAWGTSRFAVKGNNYFGLWC